MRVIQVSGRPPAKIAGIAEEVGTADSEDEVRINPFLFLF